MRLLIALMAGVGLYFAQLYLYRYFWKEGLKVTVDFGRDIVREGEENELIETVCNDKLLPLPVVQVKFSITRTFEFKKMDNSSVTDQYYRNDFFSLRPYRKITRIYGFKCEKRGLYPVNSLDVICKDLFLTGMMIRSFKPDSYVCVLPGSVDPEEIPQPVAQLTGDIIDGIRWNEDPFEFAGIREYQSYDPMNRINWKASADSQKLLVNKFYTTITRRVIIFLNAECHIKWHEETFIEEEIRLAASLADRFIENHIPVALYSNGCDSITEQPVSIGAGADAPHLLNIEISLARLNAACIKGDFAKMLMEVSADENYERTECVIISNYRKQDLYDTYVDIKDKGVNVHWIIPEYSMMEPRLTGGGDEHIVKWTVRNES